MVDLVVGVSLVAVAGRHDGLWWSVILRGCWGGK